MGGSSHKITDVEGSSNGITEDVGGSSYGMTEVLPEIWLEGLRKPQEDSQSSSGDRNQMPSQFKS